MTAAKTLDIDFPFAVISTQGQSSPPCSCPNPYHLLHLGSSCILGVIWFLAPDTCVGFPEPNNACGYLACNRSISSHLHLFSPSQSSAGNGKCSCNVISKRLVVTHLPCCLSDHCSDDLWQPIPSNQHVAHAQHYGHPIIIWLRVLLNQPKQRRSKPVTASHIHDRRHRLQPTDCPSTATASSQRPSHPLASNCRR